MCTQCHTLANKSLLPRAADYIQNYFLNCTWISLPTLQTLSQQSGLKRKGCWINIYLAIRHRRNHMAGYLCAKSFQYFSPYLSELQQQQQKFWKHNIKPSESVTWESLSIAKGNSSTKTKHDFKKAMEYSLFLTRKPPNQQPAYCNRIYVTFPTHEFGLPEKSPVQPCNKFTIYCCVQYWILCDQEGGSWRYRDWSLSMCYKQSRFWHYLQWLNTNGNT